MMIASDLVGVYRQVGEDSVATDGTVTPGIARRSQIMYTADGYMSVVSAPADRKPVTESDSRVDLDGAAPDGRAEAASSVVAYAGRYELRDGSVFHHIEMALNPNRIGGTVSRRARLKGPDLILSTEPDAQGNVRRIHWRRVEAMKD